LCLRFYSKRMDPSTACSLFDGVLRTFSEEKTVLRYICSNAGDCLRSQGFYDMSFEGVLAIVQNDRLLTDELLLFESVLIWSMHECKRRQLTLNPPNQRKVLADIVRAIRFPLMTMGDIAATVVPTGILSTEEQLNIFQYMVAAEAAVSRAAASDNKDEKDVATANVPKSLFNFKPRTGGGAKTTLFWDKLTVGQGVIVSENNTKVVRGAESTAISNCITTTGFRSGTGVHMWAIQVTHTGALSIGLGVCTNKSRTILAESTPGSTYYIPDNANLFDGTNWQSNGAFTFGSEIVVVCLDTGTSATATEATMSFMRPNSKHSPGRCTIRNGPFGQTNPIYPYVILYCNNAGAKIVPVPRGLVYKK